MNNNYSEVVEWFNPGNKVNFLAYQKSSQILFGENFFITNVILNVKVCIREIKKTLLLIRNVLQKNLDLKLNFLKAR